MSSIKVLSLVLDNLGELDHVVGVISIGALSTVKGLLGLLFSVIISGAPNDLSTDATLLAFGETMYDIALKFSRWRDH